MFMSFAYVLVILQLIAIELVLSAILCKDSRIDSITYSNDLQMYFLTSGGYYWWIKESEFPPPDSKAKRLPSPFVMGHAAVYIDSDSGCGSTSSSVTTSGSKGIGSKGKVVWVEEYVGGQHKLLAFDTKESKWSDNTIVYNSDHCISRARIDWASGKPLDAIFVRNYLELYFVQENTYAMVDCKFICTDANSFGDDKSQYKTTDLQTVDTIFGTFVKQNRMLFMFHRKTYYEMSIQPNSRNGKLRIIKDIKEKDIITDFLKISNAGQCIEPTTEAVPPTQHIQIEGGNEESVADTDSHKGNKPNEDSEGSGWSLIVIVVIVMIVVIVVAVMAFFIIRSKSGTGQETEKAEKAEKAEKPKTTSVRSKGSPSASTSSKASGAVKEKKKAESALNPSSSTITNKSNLGVVGMASKSLPSTKSSSKK